MLLLVNSGQIYPKYRFFVCSWSKFHKTRLKLIKMNILQVIRTMTITLYLSLCFCATPVDIRLRSLIKRIFYVLPAGESYFNTSTRHTETPKSNDCLSGVCVPIHLCVNGNVLTSGANLLKPRMGFDDDAEQSKMCTESEICCQLLDDDSSSNNKNINANDEFVEITETLLDKDDDYDYSDKWRPNCGIRNSNFLQPRISRDDKANDMEFPWMVMVLKRTPKSDFYDYQCGGSLIHFKVVLTAAHCVSTVKPKFLHVRAGEWDMANINEPLPHQDRSVQSIFVHREYYKPTLLNDIVILVLQTPFQLADNVNTICLPPPKHSFDNERCLVTGWGKDVKGRMGRYQTTLKKIELPIVPHNQCQNKFRKTILGKYFCLDNSFICAGGEIGKDTCQGDGGSPLVCKIPSTTNSYYQSGIVSWGIGCKQSNIPGAYVNVARYRDWIDKVMHHMKLESSSYIYEA